VSAENELQGVIDLGCIDKDEVDEHKEMDKEIKSVLRSKKHVGRLVDEFWQSFTNKLEPWKLKAAVCIHCVNKVNYHKKKEQAKVHLQKHDFYSGRK
jgi:RNAse (barnase) inhibitor barstar